MPKLRRLPRDENGNFKRTFNAKGQPFVIRTPKEGIGMYRFSRLMQMSAVMGYGGSFPEQMQNWRKVGEMLNDFVRGENNLGDIFAHVQSQYNGIKKDSDRVYHIAYYVAALFVVRPDEDMTEFVEEEQREKIDSWKEFHEEDFFALALNGLTEFSRISKKHENKAEGNQSKTNRQSNSDNTGMKTDA